ncbi:MAG: sugar phosphate nucleotidyltransferase, partial [Halobacteriaceae archaeon]
RDDLLVVAGDNVISFELPSFVDFFEEHEGSALAAYDVGSHERAKSYGLVELDGTRVVDFQEKPSNPRSTLVSIACYAFPADALDAIAQYLDAGGNPDEPGWFVQWLQEREPVNAFTFDGAWFDIGTPESYLDAVSWQLNGKNLVSDSAEIRESTLEENVHVLEGATIEDSHVDHSVVFPNATVHNCDVRESIIDEETHVENIDFSGALIGAHTRLRNADE